jgi:hypothetical protein
MARRDSILVSRTLYQIGVVTLMAAVMWVALGIYFASGKGYKVDVEKTVLEPINPNLDQEVVKALTTRLKVEVDLAPTPIATESGVR